MSEREHQIEGLDCWCQPTYLLPCDECDDGCWKCHDCTTIAITRDEAEISEALVVIVHRGDHE